MYNQMQARVSYIAYFLFLAFSALGCIASIGTIILVLMRKIRRKSLTQNTVNANSAEIVKDGIRIFLMAFLSMYFPLSVK